jgi:hypothetical protein
MGFRRFIAAAAIEAAVLILILFPAEFGQWGEMAGPRSDGGSLILRPSRGLGSFEIGLLVRGQILAGCLPLQELAGPVEINGLVGCEKVAGQSDTGTKENAKECHGAEKGLLRFSTRNRLGSNVICNGPVQMGPARGSAYQVRKHEAGGSYLRLAKLISLGWRVNRGLTMSLERALSRALPE